MVRWMKSNDRERERPRGNVGSQIGDHVPVRKLPEFHGAVGTARKQAAGAVDVHLCHSDANVTEERAAGMFTGQRQVIAVD